MRVIICDIVWVSKAIVTFVPQNEWRTVIIDPRTLQFSV